MAGPSNKEPPLLPRSVRRRGGSLLGGVSLLTIVLMAICIDFGDFHEIRGPITTVPVGHARLLQRRFHFGNARFGTVSQG